MSQSTEATASSNSSTVNIISGAAALIGLLLLASPFVFVATDTALWNHVIVGAAIFLLAGFNYYRVSNGMTSLMSAIGLIVLLGAWTIIAPFAFEIGSTELFWSTIVIGVLTLILGGSIATSERRLRAGTPDMTE